MEWIKPLCMKTKILNLLLIISSMSAYLEWGPDQSMFLIEGEMEILSKLFSDPLSVAHPFVLLPLAGQVLLLITLFQKNPSATLSLLGMAAITLLLLFIFLIGLMNLHIKILFSSLPFVVIGIISVLHHWKRKKETSQQAG